MVMAALEDGTAEGIVGRDINTTFVSKDAGFDLPVSQAGTEGERDVFVHRLEGLEDEGVACRGGFDAVRKSGVDKIDKEGWRKEGDVGVVGIVRGEEVRTAREGVRASEKFAGYMDHFQVEVSEVDEPTCLAAVECLGLTEVGKVLMVGKDLYRERGTVEVMSPGFQGANDGEKLAIIDIVVPFRRGEGLRQVGTWVPVTIRVGLEEDGARRILGGIRGDSEGGGEVGEVKNRFSEEEAFQGIKGSLARRGPIPGKVLLGEVEKGAGNVGVVGNEPTVEIGEPKERANVFHLGWCGPACDAVELDRVHG